MSEAHKKLIGDLVNDLRPVARAGRVGRPAALWLAGAIAYGVMIMLATGPLRPGALAALASHPAYVVESTLATLAIATLAVAALRSSIPGEVRPLRWVLWLLPVGAWVAVYVAELRWPPEYVSALGSRGPCEWQVVLHSLPAFGLLLFSARRLFPLQPRVTGLLAGAAAAAIPAELMQFGCMYVPTHILAFHLGPVAAMAAIGALIGPRVLLHKTAIRRRRDSPLH